MASKGAKGRAAGGMGRWMAALLGAAVLSACGGGGGGGGSSNPTSAGSYQLSGVLQFNLANPLANGLPGGLSLGDGKETLNISPGSTTFVFSTALATGTSYTVSVLTSPAGLACTASSNTGTIASSNVSNVVVDCSDVSYKVGGSVSGLTSGSVQLTDNGGDTLTVAAGMSSFNFATAVAYGGTYGVAIATQPGGQTCSVGHGSGTMAAADVTNITVTCSAQSFSLGGSVSGLAAAGLVLANGADTMAVASGATSFTFANPIASGGLYSVTVKTQPAGALCTVSNGSGTATAAITSVSVSCAAATYALGGSITWPAGLSGLSLANGAETISPSPGASSYTFATALVAGSSYSVSVTASPAGYVCTVANGAGTVKNANVSNASVTCSAQSQAYPLGGAISGLSGTGLVLANGTDTLSLAANATKFTFAQAIASGGGYAVSVQTQPGGQTCSVANGIGTMAAPGVNNVAVTCHVNSYSIGGTISGLSTSGLVLANGSDTVSPPSGAASFTLPAAVAQGSAYNVTVQAQPNGLVCTPANASGTATADVTNIAVTCSAASGVGGSVTGLHSSGLVLANGTTTQAAACTNCRLAPAGSDITLPAVSTSDLVLNPNTHVVYAPDSGGNTIVAMDPVNGTTTSISTGQPAGTGIASIAVDPTRNRLYAANNDGFLSAIDLTTNNVVGSAQIPGCAPGSMVMNPVTNKIYIAVSEFCIAAESSPASIWVVDGATLKVTTATTGGQPLALAVDTATNKVYVSDFASGNVAVIDGASNQTTLVPVGPGPGAIAVNEGTNKIYVCLSGGNRQVGPSFAVGSSVVVIDGATNATTSVMTVSGPGVMAINSATNKIYVAGVFGSTVNAVTVIDGATNQTVNIAQAGGSHVSIDMQNNLVFFSYSNQYDYYTFSGVVNVIVGTTNKVITMGDASNTVGPLVVDPTYSAIYLGNYSTTYKANNTGPSVTNAVLIFDESLLLAALAPAPATVPFFLPASAGSAYTVSVKTQPAGQTCTVSSGTGTVGSGAASAVSVTCLDNFQPLMGTMSGTTTTWANLGDGTESFVVAGGGAAFLFSIPAPLGYSYTVTAGHLGSTCTSQNSTGIVGGPVNVSFACQ